jgi:uncharacterized membrane protein (DUF485 family)
MTSGVGARVTQREAVEFDWPAIESSSDFQDLVRRKRRFVVAAASAVFACFGAYLALAVFAGDFMGTRILGGPPVGWLLASAQVLLTWVVTWLYLRKADREWEPLEQRIVERLTADDDSGRRFDR